MCYRLLFLAACFAYLGCAAEPEAPPENEYATGEFATQEMDLSAFFAEVDGPGAFVLLDGQTGRKRVYNLERAGTRFLPVSTFKIPNSLIALETGVAAGPDFALAWDSTAVRPEPWWPRSWKRDQTLRTAFQNSVYWFYQELARRIGPDTMQAYLERFDYGNQDIAPAVDTFWLDGNLRISPREQVDFLRRFYFDELGLSARTTAAVKDIMLMEETPMYRLSGKTGTAEVTSTRELGWLVGYVERGGAVHFYALNMEGEQVWEAWPPQQRIDLVRTLLGHLEVIPADGA